MQRRWIQIYVSTVLVLAIQPVLHAGQPTQNPYATAKVGDWGKLRVTQSLGGQKIEQTIKRVVVSATPTEVVTEDETTTDGKVELSRTTIDISKPRAVILTKPEATILTTRAGFERLRVAGKDLVCALAEQTDVENVPEAEIVRAVKVWSSAEIPLDGMARTELERKGTMRKSRLPAPVEKIVVELLEFGRK